MSRSTTAGAVGASPPRPDGRAKADGSARFVDDLVLPGMWHGATVRCPHPAARVLGIDVSRLAGDPDVVVVTAADLPGPNALHLIADDWRVLAEDRADHVAEAVALVAAPTKEAAQRAAAQVVVDWEPLPAVLTLDDALNQDPLQVLAACGLARGDVDQSLAGADLVIEGTYETGHHEHAYLETQGVIAVPHLDGGIEILGSLQCPFYVQKALVPLFGLPPDKVRIRQTVTGGGFGGKEDYPDMIAAHAALLARKAHRPVKIVYDRHEDILATTKRHPSRVKIRAGVRRDGTLLALDIDVLLDGGASTTLTPVVLSRAVLHAAGPYRCPSVRVRGRALATNTPPNGAFRGFGAPQSQFAMERHMDRIARATGLDPFAIRALNAYREGDVTPTGQVLHTSVTALACLEEAERRTRYREKWRDNESGRRAGRPDDGAAWKGIGISLFWHGAGFTGSGETRMRSPVRLRLAAGGTVLVLVSSTDFGQGTIAVLAQIVAQAAGIDPPAVTVVDPDTAEVPDSGPTVASRTVMIVGGALARAARRLASEVAGFAAGHRGLPADSVAVRTGRLRAQDGGDLGSFPEWADTLLATRGGLEIEEHHLPREGESFDEATYQGTAYSAYGWGCDVVEVAVDPDTFTVRPERATFVADVGRAIHPVLCEGQVEGGSLQALAWGWLEEVKMENGRCLNDRFATYIIPTTMDAPAMETVLLENPAPSGPFGAKGVGELPMDGGAPAIVAAIENATGIVGSRLPASPERLLDDLLAGSIVEGAPPAPGGL